MMKLKHINISNYSNDFIKKAIYNYMKTKESNRIRVNRYYSTEAGKKKNQLRANMYYWKKKKNMYHPVYNPEGPKT